METPEAPDNQDSTLHDSRQNGLRELGIITCGLILLPLLLSLLNSFQAEPVPPSRPGSPVALLMSAWNLVLLLFLMSRGMPLIFRQTTVWRLSLRQAGQGLALALMLTVIATVLGQILTQPSATAMPFRASDLMVTLVPSILAVIIAASFEEMLYRVYLIERLTSLGFSAGSASLVSVLLFSLGHGYQGLHGLILSLILGSALTLAWRRWRNFWIIAMGHLFYNLIVLLGAWLTGRLN